MDKIDNYVRKILVIFLISMYLFQVRDGMRDDANFRDALNKHIIIS